MSKTSNQLQDIVNRLNAVPEDDLRRMNDAINSTIFSLEEIIERLENE